jgi:uncharacterized membrane protein YphA (DoxX/SURF4 family)
MANLDKARWVLRLGLVAVFGYAAVASLVSPSDWIGYLPQFAVHIIPANALLFGFSLYQVLLCIWLLSNKYARYAAIVAAVTMVGIIFADIQLFAVTFRDIAIASGAVALAILSD